MEETMASQERLLILKMLQEGTISTEDALRLLEASAASAGQENVVETPLEQLADDPIAALAELTRTWEQGR